MAAALTVLAACLSLGACFPAGAIAGRVSGVVLDVPTGSQHRPIPLPPIRHAPVPLARDANQTLPYNGGSVLHSNRTHLIFWQPSRSGLTFAPGYEALIVKFLRDVAADSHKPTNVYGLSGQYTDSHGPAAYDSTYGGSVLATDPLPPSDCSEPGQTGPGWQLCVVDADLQTEIDHVVAADHLPSTGRDVYFLVMPDGLGSCVDTSSSMCALGGTDVGYCGYHSETGHDILYAVVPYNAVPGHCQSGNPRPNSSPADATISTVSHEHNEMVTDPFGDGWVTATDQEDGDLCITDFGPSLGGSGATAWNEVIRGDHYYLQEEWSNEDGGCRPRDETDPVQYAGRWKLPAGEVDRLTVHAHDPDGRIVSYLWKIGASTIGRHRALSHAFKHPGTYHVTLRVTDSADNWAFYTKTIRVTAERRQQRR